MLRQELLQLHHAQRLQLREAREVGHRLGDLGDQPRRPRSAWKQQIFRRDNVGRRQGCQGNPNESTPKRDLI